MMATRSTDTGLESCSEILAKKLWDTSTDGRHTEVLGLLRRGVNPNDDYYRREKSGASPLHQTCDNNHYLSAEYLIQWGATLDATTVNGRTPLHWASCYNSPGCVQVLLKYNSRTDIKDQYGDTAIDDARKQDHWAILDTLTKHKPLLPRAPLSSYPSIEQLRLLQVDQWYKLGCLLGVPEDQLQGIKKSQSLTTASLLGLSGDSVHLHPTAATLFAAKVNNMEMRWNVVVDNLLNLEEYQAVLLIAAFCGSLDMLKELVETKGQDPKDTLSKSGHTPLYLAYANRHVETVKYLVHEQQCDPNFVVNEAGDISLSLECSRGDLEMIKALANEHTDLKGPANKSGDTPIQLASKGRHWEVVKYLAISHQCDTKDLLVYAVEHKQKSQVEFLLNDCHSDPNVTDQYGRQLLTITYDPTILKLLLQHGAKADDVYNAHRELIGKLSAKGPPEIPLSIFIIGDAGVGKSTLLKSMLSNSKGFRARFTKARPVRGVDEKTVGIIPCEVTTKEFGRVNIYDFAGQQEFYASHCAILENAVQTSPPIIVYCTNLQESKQKITASTAWWMALVQNQCKDLKDRAHVIVVGTHADKLKEVRENPRDKESIFAPIIENFPKFNFVAFTPIDCRFPDTPEMTQVKKFIQSSSALLRSPEAVDLNAHAFYIYLLDSFRGALAVPVKLVQKKIHGDLFAAERQNLVSFIPSTVSRLVEICDELNRKGLVLYLHNEASPEESFIVCDRATLLSNITGTVFAPKGFRQHCNLASSTGVVPLFKFADAFKSYSTELLVEFMSCLEFCFEIMDKEVLEYLGKIEQNPDLNGRYLFFSGLIRIDIPERVWEKESRMCYHFGWILQTSHYTQFFDPRSFQVLILRIVFTFSLAPTAIVRHDIPALQRFCCVWKNGISWCNDDGVTAYLELCDNGKALALKIRSEGLEPACLEHRSKIINKVLETVADFCPHVDVIESVIDPKHVEEHPLKHSSSLSLFHVPDVAKAIAYRKNRVKSMHIGLSFKHLLQFEPYTDLDSDTLQCIHSKKNTNKNKKISNGFISRFAIQVVDIDRALMYKGILNTNPMPQSETGSPRQEMINTLERWRDQTKGTYAYLMETLNKCSVLTGRNPLDLAGVAHREVDPMLLFPDSQDESSVCLLPVDKVREALKEVRSDWYSLAVELNIDFRIRKAIDKDNSTVDAKFNALTQHWVMRNSPPPKWAALVTALKSPTIGREDVADKILADHDQVVLCDEDGELCLSTSPQYLSHQLDVDRDLRMVRTATWSARVKWNNLGILLGIPEDDRKAIEYNHYHIAEYCYTALLETWLTKTSPPPTLGALIEALESPVIDHGDSARRIKTMVQN